MTENVCEAYIGIENDGILERGSRNDEGGVEQVSKPYVHRKEEERGGAEQVSKPYVQKMKKEERRRTNV